MPETRIPRPGAPVRGSRSGAPVMALLDLFGRRWALGVLWTLAGGQPMTFRALQAACETISPGVLNQRLAELQAARFVEKGEGGYRLTPLGEDAFASLEPLGGFAKTWAARLEHG